MLKLNLQTVSELLPAQDQVKQRKENIQHLNDVMKTCNDSRISDLKQLRNIQIDALLVAASGIEDDKERKVIYDWILYVASGYERIRFYSNDGKLTKDTTDWNDAVEHAFDIISEDPKTNRYYVEVSHEAGQLSLRDWYSKAIQRDVKAHYESIERVSEEYVR
jgi:hypothetical protein